MGSRVEASLTAKTVGTVFLFSVESAIVGQAKLGLVPTPQVRVSLTQLETEWKQNDSAQVYTMEKTYPPRPETGWGYGPFTKKGETMILLTSRFSSGTKL